MSRYLPRNMILLVPCLIFVLAMFLERPRIPTLAAGPHIALSPKSEPPTSVVKVSAKGFGINESVNISFDMTQIAVVSTNNTGAFSTKITIPTAALPGNHTILAKGQMSGISASSTFLVQTNWSMFGFSSSHNHYNRYENVLNSSSVSNLSLDWSYTTGNIINSSPAVANGVVYIGSRDKNLYAINATTGTVLWTANTGGEIYSSPAISNGVVYVGSYVSDNLYAFNATTGATLWTASAGGLINSSPVVFNGIVYIGSADKNVYAFNAQTGANVWTVPTAGEVLSSPAIANGILYIGSYDGDLYALNASTDATLWIAHTGASIYSSPAVANGMVYVGSYDTNFYASNATTGSMVWSVPTGDSIYSSPAVANGIVYVGANYYVYALNAKTGKTLWDLSYWRRC